jgi:hypothetical protein
LNFDETDASISFLVDQQSVDGFGYRLRALEFMAHALTGLPARASTFL